MRAGGHRLNASARRTVELDLSDYRPTPSQARFLAATERAVMFSGGYGGGKTRWGAEKALRLAVWNPGVSGLVVSPTYQMLTRTTRRTLREVIPKQVVAEDRAADRELRLVNGSTIYFGSTDKPGSLEGTNVAWAWIDEGRLVSAEAWRTIVGRVRDRRARLSQILVTTTPAMGWLYDEFGVDRPGERRRVIVNTAENAHNLAPGFVEELRRTHSARLARSMIDGEFALASGAVFEEWSARNLVQWTYQPTCRTVLAVDFGVRSPSVLLLQVTPEFLWPLPDGSTLPARSVVVVDELHPEQTPTVRLVEAVKARWPALRIDAIYCDPAGSARDQNSGMPSVFTLEHGLGVRPSFSTEAEDRWIPNGIALLQGMLAPVEGPPRLYVSRALAEARHRRGVIAVMEGYRYPEAKDGRPTSDQPVKDGVLDHCADALRYGCLGIVRDEGRAGSNLRLLRTYAGPR